jgi:hypothetical protein
MFSSCTFSVVAFYYSFQRARCGELCGIRHLGTVEYVRSNCNLNWGGPSASLTYSSGQELQAVSVMSLSLSYRSQGKSPPKKNQDPDTRESGSVSQ